jgi:hypothetical protein
MRLVPRTIRTRGILAALRKHESARLRYAASFVGEPRSKPEVASRVSFRDDGRSPPPTHFLTFPAQMPQESTHAAPEFGWHVPCSIGSRAENETLKRDPDHRHQPARRQEAGPTPTTVFAPAGLGPRRHRSGRPQARPALQVKARHASLRWVSVSGGTAFSCFWTRQ